MKTEGYNYVPLSHEEEDGKSYLQVPDGGLALQEGLTSQHNQRGIWSRVWPFAIHILLLTTSICIVVFGGRREDACRRQNDVLLDTHPKERMLRFDGSFDRASPFKGPPTTDVEDSWDDILPLQLMAIPETVFQSLNASKHAVKVPPELGEGRLAIFEAIHQVHCVRMLWEGTYPEWHTREKEDPPEWWRKHVDHCADMLRQKLMCDADTRLITYNWLKEHRNPHPNFHVQHKCRSYDQLLAATHKYGIPHSAIPEGGIVRPEGEQVVEFSEPPFDPFADE